MKGGGAVNELGRPTLSLARATAARAPAWRVFCDFIGEPSRADLPEQQFSPHGRLSLPQTGVYCVSTAGWWRLDLARTAEE